jgi:hypothetical protein
MPIHIKSDTKWSQGALGLPEDIQNLDELRERHPLRKRSTLRVGELRLNPIFID